jgi:hypothetical protein
VEFCFELGIFLSNDILLKSFICKRNEFRGALDSVEKVQELKDVGKISHTSHGGGRLKRQNI